MPKGGERGQDGPRNIYLRDGIWWGRIKVQGRTIRWSLRTRDERTALRRAKERRDRELAAAHFGEHRHTYEEVFVAWSEHIAAQVKASSVERYAVSLGQLAYKLRPLFLDEVTRPVLSEIVRERRAKGVTNATIRRDLTALSSLLGFAEGEGWRDDNPALAALRKLRERRDPIVLPELADIDRVVKIAPGNFARLIEAGLMTGCRIEELVTLERRQLDLSRAQLTLYRTKTSRPRAVPLSAVALALFRSIPQRLGCKSVFWHSGGLPYANASSRFAVLCRRAQKRAQEEKVEFRVFRFHDLRHRFAVDELRRGTGLYDLQQMLGHSSVKTTEGYLAYLTPEEARAAKGGGTRYGTQVERFGGAI